MRRRSRQSSSINILKCSQIAVSKCGGGVLTGGLQRDVVYLCWPIAPSYMSPNAGGWGRGCGVSANEYSCAHHVTWSPIKLWRSTSKFYLWVLRRETCNSLFCVKMFSDIVDAMPMCPRMKSLGCSVSWTMRPLVVAPDQYVPTLDPISRYLSWEASRNTIQ